MLPVNEVVNAVNSSKSASGMIALLEVYEWVTSLEEYHFLQEYWVGEVGEEKVLDALGCASVVGGGFESARAINGPSRGVYLGIASGAHTVVRRASHSQDRTYSQLAGPGPSTAPVVYNRSLKAIKKNRELPGFD
jgi:hypothetical protein